MVGLKIISLWRHKIDLNEIVIDHPSIHVFVDQNGKSNLVTGRKVQREVAARVSSTWQSGILS